MSAVMEGNNSLSASNKGLGFVLVGICYVIMIGLIMANVYHTDNFLSSLLVDDPASLFALMVTFISVSLCLSEIPLSKSIVTDYRFNKDQINFKIVMKSLLGCALASLAIAGTLNSQHMNASAKDAEVQSHGSASGGFEARKKQLDSQWRADTRAANELPKADRDIRQNNINAAYFGKTAALLDSQSLHQAKKPKQSYKAGSFGQVFTSAVLAIVCSFGLMFVSGFLTVYHAPIVPQMLMSLVTKKDHGYQSKTADIKMMQHEISPLIKGAVYAFFAKRLGTFDSPALNVQKSSTVHHPELDESRVGAIKDSSLDTSDRTLNTEAQKGAKVDYSDAHYQAIKDAVLRGTIKPTQKPVRSQLVKLNVRFVDDAARARKASEILDKLAVESVLIENPDFNQGGKVVAKYLLNPDYQNQEPVLEQKGDEMISSICPECKHQSRVSESNLAKWGGKVGCPECPTNYTVADNLAKPEEAKQ